jgi:hypothetical protein
LTPGGSNFRFSVWLEILEWTYGATDGLVQESLNPDSAVGTDRSAMHDLSAAMGFYLSAFIDQLCFDENAHTSS